MKGKYFILNNLFTNMLQTVTNCIMMAEIGVNWCNQSSKQL